MTHSIRPWRGPRVVAAAAVLAALAGCSSTHVGESWQCPLSQGGTCTSVAGADPAVPARAGEATGRVLGEPLYRVRAEPVSTGPRDTVRTEQPCETECGPFTWLARLFGTDTDAAHDEPAAARSAARPVIETPLPLPDGESPVHGEPAHDDPAPGDTADDDPVPIEPASKDLVADDLREPEFVGRIWIAPFVDGDGIYREGAYVRLVIAPARWRLP